MDKLLATGDHRTAIHISLQSGYVNARDAWDCTERDRSTQQDGNDLVHL